MEFSDDLAAFGTRQIKVDPRIGKRLGHKMKEVLAAARNGEHELLEDGRALVAGETLARDEFEMRLICDGGGEAESFGGTGAVILDISVDEEQKREGTARDLVRVVQNARKDAGLHVSDRITLGVDGSSAIVEAAKCHAQLIASQTLALDLEFGVGDGVVSEHEMRGERFRLSIRKAERQA